MTMIDGAARTGLGELDGPLVSSPVTMPLVVLEVLPVEPSGVLTCSQRLPRDVLVRLTSLSRQVDHIRHGGASHADLSIRLGKVAVGLDALIQSIYDETALHFASRRG